MQLANDRESAKRHPPSGPQEVLSFSHRTGKESAGSAGAAVFKRESRTADFGNTQFPPGRDAAVQALAG